MCNFANAVLGQESYLTMKNKLCRHDTILKWHYQEYIMGHTHERHTDTHTHRHTRIHTDYMRPITIKMQE